MRERLLNDVRHAFAIQSETEAIKAIHTHFNDMESRTCENCLKKLYCSVLGVLNSELPSGFDTTDFNCNNWELGL